MTLKTKKNKTTKPIISKEPFNSTQVIASYKSKIDELNEKINAIKPSIPKDLKSERPDQFTELSHLIESVLQHGRHLCELMGNRQKEDYRLTNHQKDFIDQVIKLQSAGTCVLESLSTLSRPSMLPPPNLNEENYSLRVALEDAHRSSDELYERLKIMETELSKVSTEKEQADLDRLECKQKLEELTCEFNRYRIRCKSLEASSPKQKKCHQQRLEEKDSLIADLNRKICSLKRKSEKDDKSNVQETNSLLLENEKLKQALERLKNKLSDEERQKNKLIADSKSRQQNIHEYEKLIESREISNEEWLKDEINKINAEKESQINSMRNNVLEKLHELEHIPELLKSTELQLIDAKTKAEESEAKAKRYYEQLEFMNKQVSDDLYPKMTHFEEKMISMEVEKNNLKEKLCERDNEFREIMAQHDFKAQENAKLTKNLEQALQELKKFSSGNISGYEKLNFLSQQVGSLKKQVQALQAERDKESLRSVERISELEMELEQSNSLNRSLQDYVDFLRSTCDMNQSEPELLASTSPQKYPNHRNMRTL